MNGFKNSAQIGLYIGESFAEAIDLAMPTTFQRWWLMRKSLAEVLREFLAPRAEQGGTLGIVSHWPQALLLRGLAHAPALLVTAGFESWIALQTPKNWSPELRQRFRLNPDLIFAVDERLSVNGEILKPLAVEELQSLADKLKLAKVKTVAIGFLHARRHAQHEQQAAQFLREQGFEVVASHELTGEFENEFALWWQTAATATMQLVQKEHMAEFENVLGEYRDKWQLHFSWPYKNSPPTYNLVHLGLERFEINGKPMRLQPTRTLDFGAWGAPIWNGPVLGYEPGPLCLGKSQNVTWLDVMSHKDKKSLDPLLPWVSEKSCARLPEIVHTLGKAYLDLSAPQSPQALSDLWRLGLEMLRQDLLLYLDPQQPVQITGAWSALWQDIGLSAYTCFPLEEPEQYSARQAALLTPQGTP